METTDNLNLEQARRYCILKALNKAQTVKAAAELAGVTERTIHRYIRSWGITWNGKTLVYEIKPRAQKAILI